MSTADVRRIVNASSLLTFCVLLSLSCHQSDSLGSTVADYVYILPQQTSDGWITASMQSEGMDVGPMIQLMNFLRGNPDNYLHSILVVRSGKLVFEEYFAGVQVDFDDPLTSNNEVKYASTEFNAGILHMQSSVSKSFTSALVGLAIEGGRLSSVEQKVFAFFPDHANLTSPAKSAITLKQCLTMSSGLPFDDGTYPIADPRNDEFGLFTSADPVNFTLGRSLFAEPGTTFKYNSGTTVVLGEIVKRATSQPLPQFAEQYLFKPLQISSYRWVGLMNAKQTTFASGGLYLTPRSMAKFGQLYLQNGIWNGRRVLSEAWVRNSTMPIVSVNEGKKNFQFFGYGYQWWIGKFTSRNLDCFAAQGWGGQFIVVIPARQMVVVLTGGLFNAGNPFSSNVAFDPYNFVINEHILEAVR